MAEIVNLRMARKKAARERREELADKNRAAYSVPGRVRRAARAESDREQRILDGHRRQEPESERG